MKRNKQITCTFTTNHKIMARQPSQTWNRKL